MKRAMKKPTALVMTVIAFHSQVEHAEALTSKWWKALAL